MLASYLLSRMLVPALAMYLLKRKDHAPTRNSFTRLQRGFDRGFERVRASYISLLDGLVSRRRTFVPAFLLLCLCAFLLVPWLGQDFFPNTDSGQFISHVRGPSGMRIEETARLCDLVERNIREHIPAKELDNVLDNIGMPYSTLNTQHLTNGSIGAYDADVMVSLKEDHHPTAKYVAALRRDLPRAFPNATFYFLPADITTQILNFGLLAPLHIQVDGNDVEASEKFADKMLAQLRQLPGITDLRMQQPFDVPTFNVAVNRTKASQGRYSERDVATSILNKLSGSFQVTPMFFLN